MRRKLEAMDIQRRVADNLVLAERNRGLERCTHGLTKVIASLYGVDCALITAAFLLDIDVPAEEGLSAKDTARLGG